MPVCGVPCPNSEGFTRGARRLDFISDSILYLTATSRHIVVSYYIVKDTLAVRQRLAIPLYLKSGPFANPVSTHS